MNKLERIEYNNSRNNETIKKGTTKKKIKKDSKKMNKT